MLPIILPDDRVALTKEEKKSEIIARIIGVAFGIAFLAVVIIGGHLFEQDDKNQETNSSVATETASSEEFVEKP